MQSHDQRIMLYGNILLDAWQAKATRGASATTGGGVGLTTRTCRYYTRSWMCLLIAMSRTVLAPFSAC